MQELRFTVILTAVLAILSGVAWAQPAPAAGTAPADPAPAAPAAADPAAAAAAPAAAAAGDSETSEGEAAASERSGDARYEARLREIEERVVGIKERIFNTKTRLLLLKEQILDNVIAESRAVLSHRNEMGSFFELDHVLYWLDGRKIYYQDNSNGMLTKRKDFEIYNGSIIPGNHTLNVELVYKGNSSVFTYLNGYTFKLKSSYTFYAAKGRITSVSIVGYERGGIGTELEDKPYIRYEVKQLQNKAKSQPATAKQ